MSRSARSWWCASLGLCFYTIVCGIPSEILSSHRVLVCRTTYRVIRLLAHLPCIIGFWQWKLASLGLIREAHCQQEISASETEKTSGKEERPDPSMLLCSAPDEGWRTGAVPTYSECGCEEVLLCTGRKPVTLFLECTGLLFSDHTLL